MNHARACRALPDHIVGVFALGRRQHADLGRTRYFSTGSHGLHAARGKADGVASGGEAKPAHRFIASSCATLAVSWLHTTGGSCSAPNHSNQSVTSFISFALMLRVCAPITMRPEPG